MAGSRATSSADWWSRPVTPACRASRRWCAGYGGPTLPERMPLPEGPREPWLVPRSARRPRVAAPPRPHYTGSPSVAGPRYFPSLPFHMKNVSLPLHLGCLALVLAACGQQPAAPAAQAAESKSSEVASAPSGGARPAAAPTAAPKTETPGDAAPAALRPESNPANARNAKRYEGGLEKLDSSYDLSKVNLDEK